MARGKNLVEASVDTPMNDTPIAIVARVGHMRAKVTGKAYAAGPITDICCLLHYTALMLLQAGC